MVWADSLLPADIAELTALGQSLDQEAFSFYLYLVITIRVMGPIENWPNDSNPIWDQIRHLFRVGADGSLYIKQPAPRVVA